MTRFLTISEARKQLLEMPDTLQEEPVIITRHGKPVMAALSYEQFESLAETLDLLGEPAFIADLRESVTQAERGERVSLADVRARLER
ncbi:prevent-host-death family protein (plasmid) [Deinococcus geothermalis DSM 11300]|uniref:Antitoxin n=1 Tax=Deinococcus geothermalis (strain DSM 11300 / CIP 105573 / AG-3a) TaxID=319795 RepID=A8ZR40_DEIGD|nr:MULTISPECIES: type II toxin-antitoxin system Phd/YefM family antitoxin [Deinococcus]ABW34949.1 prevent-host-death family protein [Deinococcus geothermalis DSM 11300]TDE84589.1 type II toxin-antitoxin system Phd/YefM family antitoxin [Deinococcus sp. S9]